MRIASLLFALMTALVAVAQQSTDLQTLQKTYSWTGSKWVLSDSMVTEYDGRNNRVTRAVFQGNPTIPAEKRSETWDAANNQIMVTRQLWDAKSASLMNDEQELMQYDSLNRKVTRQYQYWRPKENAWRTTSRGYTTYNLRNLEKNHSTEKWDTLTKTFVNNSVFTCLYDSRQNVALGVFKDWSPSNMQYYDVQRNYFTYDDHNRKLTETIEVRTRPSSPFGVSEKHQWTYDAAGNVIRSSYKYYDERQHAFVDGPRRTSVYDAHNNKLSELVESCSRTDSVYLNWNRFAWTYDANNNRMTELWEQWDEKSNTWTMYERRTYTYDDRNNRSTDLLEEWDAASGKFVPKRLEKYTYKQASSYRAPEIKPVIQTWTPEQLAAANTAKDIPNLSIEEKEAILYINLARLYPQLFAAYELEDYAGIKEWSVDMLTSSYKQSLMEQLKTMEPVKALYFDPELYEDAKCFAKESGENGVIGHNRKTCKKRKYAENCAYGMSTGRDIALQWMIDQSVPDLGHRKNCLDPRFSRMAATFHPHTTKKICAVAEYGF